MSPAVCALRVRFHWRRCRRLSKTLWRNKARHSHESTARAKKIISWLPMRRSFCLNEFSVARPIRSTLCSFRHQSPRQSSGQGSVRGGASRRFHSSLAFRHSSMNPAPWPISFYPTRLTWSVGKTIRSTTWRALPVSVCARPASKPLHQSRNTADVVLQVAQSLGGTDAKNFPWKNFEELLRAGAEGSVQIRPRLCCFGQRPGSAAQSSRTAGLLAGGISGLQCVLEWFAAKGRVVGPDRSAGEPQCLLQTPSGKFEFYSTRLKQLLDKSREQTEDARKSYSPNLAPTSRRTCFTCRRWRSGAKKVEAFPLRLNTYRLMSRPMGGGKNQPWLLEQPAVHLQASWESWVEIHPQTAAGWVLRKTIGCGSNRPKAE